MLEEFIGDELSISVSNLPKPKQFRQDIWALRQPAGAIVLFSKWCLPRLKQRTLDILRWKNVRSCIDYVDFDLRESVKFRPDIHLAASLTAMKALKKLTAGQEDPESRVSLLHHNLDERMIVPAEYPSDRLRPVYFGALENTIATDAIRERVTFLKADQANEVAPLFRQLAKFNLHYCIRRPAISTEVIAKPFTKGFVASHIGVPVLISKNVDDALDLLGNDYPFVVEDTAEREILAGLDHVADSFGGPVWSDAKDRVASLQTLCSREAIAGQFMDIVSSLR
ncbi:hypothetical protein QO034_21695 [Sedimentitalea sp. JM2-8]|uniref:Glycosyl transferases group 1 n=1 Tax=Sedimentitalea xiamensis TaxID=3050037 RepID=A0ABT7FKL5_9RHOB|nr:hypothetical protein [Sedimentitalea xiamensis]MDK3075685.1 hypothetical protein [Sedimentitalea xiamensis]